MATILFKDGESTLVEYDALKRHLDSGWSVSEETEESEDVVIDEAKASDLDLNSLENSEVRELAKQENIENWETGRIKSLKEALSDVYKD